MDGLQQVRAWAREMLTGHLSPIDGARRIAAAGPGPDDELAVFDDLARHWDAGGDARDECERRILDEAAKLVADTA